MVLKKLFSIPKCVGSFNHRVVSYLYCIQAGETGVLYLIEIGWNTNCIMPPERELPNSSLRTSEGVILIALHGYNKELPTECSEVCVLWW